MLPVSVVSFLTFVNVEMTPETAFAAGVPAKNAWVCHNELMHLDELLKRVQFDGNFSLHVDSALLPVDVNGFDVDGGSCSLSFYVLDDRFSSSRLLRNCP